MCVCGGGGDVTQPACTLHVLAIPRALSTPFTPQRLSSPIWRTFECLSIISKYTPARPELQQAASTAARPTYLTHRV